MDRKPIFDAVRSMLGRGFTRTEVTSLDAAIDASIALAGVGSPSARQVSPKGIALMHKWEGCARRRPDGLIEAYPDPGSKDGKPWTIGWGSTGSDIAKGTVWTQEQADARFERDLVKYAAEVADAIGSAPTTQDQFDALVAFHYNTGAIRKATLTKKHKAGDYAGAAAEFEKWIYNDGKPLEGLRKRRADEAALYMGKWS